jgi:hypothetical protein
MATKPITFIKKGGGLFPDHDTDRAEFDERLGDGEVITTDLRPSVDRKGNAQFWAIIGKAFKLVKNWDTAEELADAAKIAAGHAVLTTTLRGKHYFMAKSLSEVEDWDDFIATVITKLAEQLHLDERLLRDTESVSKETKAKDVSDETTLSGDSVEPLKPFPPEQQDPAFADLTPRMCMEALFELAANPVWHGKLNAQLDAIAYATAEWVRRMPQHQKLVRKIGVQAVDIAEERIREDRARKLIEAQLPQ